MSTPRTQARPKPRIVPVAEISGREEAGQRLSFRKPANDNRMPAHQRLALWALPLVVLILAAAIIWVLA